MEEREKVVEDVDRDRRYAIDACIVRIMKSRKVLPHQQLVAQCAEQLSRMFKVTNKYSHVGFHIWRLRTFSEWLLCLFAA